MKTNDWQSQLVCFVCLLTMNCLPVWLCLLCATLITNMLRLFITLLMHFITIMVESTVTPMENAHVALEAAGAGIMQRQLLAEIGGKLVECGENLDLLSQRLEPIALECSGRMVFGAEKMKEAGNNLAGVQKEKPKGKAWLKG